MTIFSSFSANIIITFWQLTMSMHQFGSLICSQHDKLMVKMILTVGSSSRPSMSLTSFLPTAEEKCSMTYLHEGVFCCILLKQAQPNQEGSVLPGISSLLNCIQQQKGGVQCCIRTNSQ